jgi:cytochrome P450
MATAREGDEDYLDALVKEILRIRAPSPIGAAGHMIEPFEIGDWTIPPDVSAKPGALH